MFSLGFQIQITGYPLVLFSRSLEICPLISKPIAIILVQVPKIFPVDHCIVFCFHLGSLQPILYIARRVLSSKIETRSCYTQTYTPVLKHFQWILTAWRLKMEILNARISGPYYRILLNSEVSSLTLFFHTTFLPALTHAMLLSTDCLPVCSSARDLLQHIVRAQLHIPSSGEASTVWD